MLNFPDAPVVNQTYTDGTTAWKWDGAKWVTTLLFTDAPSDSSTYGRRNAAWNKVLPLTGGTLTGDLTVNSLNLIVGTSTTAGANLTLNSVSPPSSGVDAGIRLQSAGRNRWWVHLNGIEGGGANFGSNFVVNRHDDAGVWLDSPLVISRWSGIVSFTASPTGPTPPPGDGSPKFATTAFVKTGYLPLTGGILTGPAIASDFTVGTNTASSTFALNGPANGYKTIQFYTAALSRWAIYANPETGSGNGGSDLVFNRYNDAGTFIDQPLKITRSTGDVTLGSKLVVVGDTTLYAALYVNGSGSFGVGSAAVGITFNGSVSNRLITIQSAGVGRWQFGANPDAESSPAVGSNFVIYRFDNAGGYLGTALQIDRATGNITVGGNLTVAATNLVINGPAGSTRQFLYQTAGSLRWLVAATSTGEAAGNVGSDYAIGRCDNTGTYIDLPLTIARSTGNVSLAHSLTVTGQATLAGVIADTLSFVGNLGGGTPPGGNVAMGWNYASGSGEFDFFNNYQAAATAFSFWQKTGATTFAQIMLLSATGNLSLTGTVAASGATITGAAGLTVNDNASLGAQASQVISATANANGAGLQLRGNGATTPNKTISAHNGNFEIINHAYNSVPFSMTDVGATTITHVDGGLYALTLTNTVSGNGAGLRLVGNGATTPNKTVRACDGRFDVVNHAYNGILFSVTDAGRTLVGANTADDGVTTLQVNGGAFMNDTLHISNQSGGAGLLLTGPGATPDKWLRAYNGTLNFINSANSVAIMVLDDGGNLSTAASISTGGHIYCGDGAVSTTFGFSATGTSLQTTYIPNSWDVFETSQLRRNFMTAGVVVASMNSDGSFTIGGATAVKPGGGAWAAPSDERIKTVHGDYDRGLDAICALQPVRYSYLGNATLTAPPEDGEDETWLAKHYLAPADQDGTERIGLVAQAVEGTFPECVTATLGYIDGEEVDDMRHLDTSPMLFALCNAVRELRDRVVELEAAAR